MMLEYNTDLIYFQQFILIWNKVTLIVLFNER